MAPSVQMILLTFADASVGVMSFVTHDLRAGWSREATDANIMGDIAKLEESLASGPDAAKVPVRQYKRIDQSEIPTDRTYRDAWVNDQGKIAHDMPKARAIHLQRIRARRAERLDQLDREWQRANGQGSKLLVQVIEADRQELRDLPTKLGVENAKTVDELKALWSPLLEG